MTKLRGGIIGFGNIAQHGHWPSYAKSNDVEIVAVVDSSPARQTAAKALKPDLHLYSSMDELWRSEKLDFVDICTPPSSHAALAVAALKQKAHVMCEKPLTLNVADYRELANAVSASDRALFT